MEDTADGVANQQGVILNIISSYLSNNFLIGNTCLFLFSSSKRIFHLSYRAYEGEFPLPT
jgi:hypothetical protein